MNKMIFMQLCAKSVNQRFAKILLIRKLCINYNINFIPHSLYSIATVKRDFVFYKQSVLKILNNECKIRWEIQMSNVGICLMIPAN